MPHTRRTVLLVSAVFMVVSFIRVPIPGVNEPHYLCKAKAFANPEWCSRDPFLNSGNAHYVFFAIVGPLTQFMSLPAVATCGRILSLLLLATGWVALGQQARLSSQGIVMSACLFCLLGISGNFSGEWIIGGFESKVPAYAFALLATATWIDARLFNRRRVWARSGLWAGLSVALHPVAGLWFCIGIALAETTMWMTQNTFRHSARHSEQNLSLWAWLGNGVTFSLAAIISSLPGLLPALNLLVSDTVSSTDADQANYIQIFWRLAHHLDPSVFPTEAWIHALVLFLVASTCMLTRAGKQQDQFNRFQLPMFVLLLMSLLIATAGIAVGWHSRPALELPDWQWRASLLKFYPFRFFDALLPIVVSFLVTIVVEHVSSMEDSGVKNSPTAAGNRKWRQGEAARWMLLFITGATLAVAMFASRQSSPSSYSRSDYKDWQSACGWLKEHTPKDCLVFTPRESFAFKWFAERAEYVCFKDCPQDAAGILQWNQRLWTIFQWANFSYRDSLFDNTELADLHEQTQVDYVITRSLGPFEAEPVYRNGTWRVYQVSNQTQ